MGNTTCIGCYLSLLEEKVKVLNIAVKSLSRIEIFSTSENTRKNHNEKDGDSININLMNRKLIKDLILFQLPVCVNGSTNEIEYSR